MLAKLSGELIRRQRAKKGLTQAEVARAAKVSRTVLSRLEQGKASAVQSDVLDRLFDALQTKLDVTLAPAVDPARVTARLERERQLDKIKERHLRLAIEIAAGGSESSKMIQKAKERVALWRRKESCSPYYIERWARILARSPSEIATTMASLGEWETAMFQNSPWSWAWT